MKTYTGETDFFIGFYLDHLDIPLQKDSIRVLCAAFNVFDTDKNGRIDLKELRNLQPKIGSKLFCSHSLPYIRGLLFWLFFGVLKTLGEEVTDEQLHEMMTIADLDNNGTIDFEEFKVFMQT